MFSSPTFFRFLDVGGIYKQETFSRQIRVITRPADADTATLRGAARYGLSNGKLISSVISPKSYLMKVGGLPSFPYRTSDDDDEYR